MDVFLAWFSDDIPDLDWSARARARLESAVTPLVSQSHVRREFGGADWGIVVFHVPPLAAWPMLAEEEHLIAVSLGLPIGLDVGAGPIALAHRILAGDDIHSNVLPPFGFAAVGDRTMAIQQDWLGMCRLFTARSGHVSAFSTKPTLLARFLDIGLQPDRDGWSSYAVRGHFGGDSTPILGVHLLPPGQRITGRRRDGGGWELAWSVQFDVTRLIAQAIEARARGLSDTVDEAAEALTAVARAVDALQAPVRFGLSGGKDSRVLAASFIAAGKVPDFRTNEDTVVEGDVARQLVDVLRQKRGVSPRHEIFRVGDQVDVLRVGLVERIRRLQRAYDYQFPSSYSVRPAVEDRLPDRLHGLGITGAGGELLTGYWYPRDPSAQDDDLAVATGALRARLGITWHTAVTEGTIAEERGKIDEIGRQAHRLGLRGFEILDYAYLIERVRRWYISSAYVAGGITPFLAPAVVRASFVLSPSQKWERILHTHLLERYLPEWNGVPFVSGGTGLSTATRVWDGDGIQATSELLDTVRGPLVELMRHDAVKSALVEAARGDGTAPNERNLQQFAWLAVATMELAPDMVRSPASSTYSDVMRLSSAPKQHPDAAVPPRRPPAIGWLMPLIRVFRPMKRTAVGRWVWAKVRGRVVGR